MPYKEFNFSPCNNLVTRLSQSGYSFNSKVITMWRQGCHNLVTWLPPSCNYHCQQPCNNHTQACRDNYDSLTSAILPPKNEDGQLKSICVDKKANKISMRIEKIICVIRIMAALKVMITLHPQELFVVKSG